jgi:hypothetical protein
MHVGAPIRDNGKIIGVVTVAKPNSSLQPYVDRTERRLLFYGAGLIGLGLLFGALLSWWLSRALHRLTGYAQAVSEGGEWRCRITVAASWSNWPRRWSRCAPSWKARLTSSATCTP